mmetsp:Transcript_108319/g.316881  ORF Transcript_108319/g.316881 Transcript_108319/m.316881 type:complete len:96 (+) Transcript_108319:408-695(+)
MCIKIPACVASDRKQIVNHLHLSVSGGVSQSCSHSFQNQKWIDRCFFYEPTNRSQVPIFAGNEERRQFAEETVRAPPSSIALKVCPSHMEPLQSP